MYQVIARKYRPASFSELISQEHVRTTLSNAISLRRIAHGYILSGQRGTGKTTVARIIARCLNCINGPTAAPCGECSSCKEIAAGNSVDVIEIDAASNRGINEMRELRENVRYRPARDRYKVFIVDEAHQITSEAFNALLKTLEEPPEWVVFILCTTESHKIPVTIASRCQQFSFRSVDYDELVARMRWICEQEGIQADDETLGILARVGEGSVRDSLSALDQAIACCGNVLDPVELRSLMGLFSVDSLGEVSSALLDGDSQRMLEIVQELERNGRSLHHFCRELSRYFRNLLVARISSGETKLIGASGAEQERLRETASRFSEEDLTRYLHLSLELFKDIQTSLQPRLHLEMGLLRLVHAGKLLPIEQALNALKIGEAPLVHAKVPAPTGPAPRARTGPSPFALDATRKASPSPAPTQPPPSTPKASVETATATSTAVAEPPSDLKAALYQALLDLHCNFTADAVEASEISENNGELTFVTPPEYRLAMSENDLRKAAQQALGKPYKVKVIIGTPANVGPVTPSKPAAPSVEEEVMQRALSDPAIQSFREAFPDAEIRQVRNLKDRS
ncbi:MAG TPA: DNA polymerase III subunit gamma/tau [Bryobacteraceae bacterium]|nr:DNA polymerase III subunit gamma/tau [Bryobacteraceae bacterium]